MSNANCLHCAVKAVIVEWSKLVDLEHKGQKVIDATCVVQELAMVVVDMVNALPRQEDKQRLMRFAHDALDATLHASKSGERVSVETPRFH